MTYVILTFHYTWFVNGMHALPSNKISQNFTNFQIHEDCVAMETELFISNKEVNISEGLFVYAVLQKDY